MPAAGQVVELIGMKAQRVVGGQVKGDDAERRTSIEKRGC
jgi:hypothetical protein